MSDKKVFTVEGSTFHSPLVGTILPDSLKKLSGRIFTLEEMFYITAYHRHTSSSFAVRDTVAVFDAGEFIGITLMRCGSRYTVFALHETIKHGPEFHISDVMHSKMMYRLRLIVMDYLEKHKEQDIYIDQFM